MSHPKLLKRPAKMLFIALVATASATISPRAAPPRAARLVIEEKNQIPSSVRARTRTESQMSEGVQRWGLNE